MEEKDKDMPDMQNGKNGRPSGKVTPTQLISAIIGVLMLVITTVSLTNTINVSAAAKEKRYVDENIITRLNSHESAIRDNIADGAARDKLIVELSTKLTVIIEAITELKSDIKDLR